jgi:hypothetical protein
LNVHRLGNLKTVIKNEVNVKFGMLDNEVLWDLYKSYGVVRIMKLRRL